ncbi:MAG: hypothetical protein K0S25_642, partial [Bacillus sp. (in: firmicutes)]|nr:hypothetical protein [Bacillus sp. (in: firmicutes)]
NDINSKLFQKQQSFRKQPIFYSKGETS